MPRVNPINPYYDQETMVYEWIKTGVAKKKIRQIDLINKVGMTYSTFCLRLRNPGTFKIEEIWRMEKVIGSLHEFSKKWGKDNASK